MTLSKPKLYYEPFNGSRFIHLLTVSHESPLTPLNLPLCHSAPAVVDSMLFLQQSRQPLTSETVCMLFPSPRKFFPQISACLIHSLQVSCSNTTFLNEFYSDHPLFITTITHLLSLLISIALRYLFSPSWHLLPLTCHIIYLLIMFFSGNRTAI